MRKVVSRSHNFAKAEKRFFKGLNYLALATDSHATTTKVSMRMLSPHTGHQRQHSIAFTAKSSHDPPVCFVFVSSLDSELGLGGGFLT